MQIVIFYASKIPAYVERVKEEKSKIEQRIQEYVRENPRIKAGD